MTHCVRNPERALSDEGSLDWTGFMESSSEGGSRAKDVGVNIPMVGSQYVKPTVLMGDSSPVKKRTSEMFARCAGMVVQGFKVVHIAYSHCVIAGRRGDLVAAQRAGLDTPTMCYA